jgi:hypothetical protein
MCHREFPMLVAVTRCPILLPLRVAQSCCRCALPNLVAVARCPCTSLFSSEILGIIDINDASDGCCCLTKLWYPRGHDGAVTNIRTRSLSDSRNYARTSDLQTDPWRCSSFSSCCAEAEIVAGAIGQPAVSFMLGRKFTCP